MKKERNEPQTGGKPAGKKLTLRKEAVHRLDPDSMKPAAGGACVTHYCRSGWSCLCSSG
ncbi:MAG TPA: class I lanthipeptide [Thermoanaerobaculia bacterium]|nr:class I lanthipeptide [Thermoanaerobaculia bacterium]